MHQRLEVAVEYGLFWPSERLFSPYFTATRNWCKECPRVPAGKERLQVLPKYRLSEKKYRSPFIMVVLALGLSTIAPIKEMRKVTESLGRGPNQSL